MKNMDKVFDWITGMAEKYPYGEIGIKLIMHNGKIKRIEKQLIEKVQADHSSQVNDERL